MSTHRKKTPRRKAYARWLQMNDRCYNPSNASFYRYGMRGIRVCKQWRLGTPGAFEAYYAYVGDPPPGCSLDRINNDGDYEPGNVRWATPSEQGSNRAPSDNYGRGKLNEREVLDIDGWLDMGVKQRIIASWYGVTSVMISRIKCGRDWGWLTGRTPEPKPV